MRKNKVMRLIVALIVIAVALFFISGTYSRYSTTGAGNASIDVAKWSVAIKKGDTSLTSTTQNLTFTVQDNDYVVSNKIAPATTATADIDVYLEGTEVAVDLITTLGSASNLPEGATLSMTVDGTTYTSGNAATFALPNGNAFTAANGKKTVKLTLTWENSDSRNASDTAAGKAANTITLPINITAQQHIS